MTFRRPAAVSI